MSTVWLVFAESGEYEFYNYALRGVFVDKGVANGYAESLRRQETYLSAVTVTEWDVMTSPPRSVTRLTWAARIDSAGNEENIKREAWPDWSHETPRVEGRISLWGKGQGDLYIEVGGHDYEAVRAAYARLREEALRRLTENRFATW